MIMIMMMVEDEDSVPLQGKVLAFGFRGSGGLCDPFASHAVKYLRTDLGKNKRNEKKPSVPLCLNNYFFFTSIVSQRDHSLSFCQLYPGRCCSCVIVGMRFAPSWTVTQQLSPNSTPSVSCSLSPTGSA